MSREKLGEHIKALRWVIVSMKPHAEYAHSQWKDWKAEIAKAPLKTQAEMNKCAASASEAYWQGYLDALNDVINDITKKIELRGRPLLAREQIVDLIIDTIDKGVPRPEKSDRG